MNADVRCPRCRQAVQEGGGCRHLRWVPKLGGPIDFAKFAVRSSPSTERRGFSASSIPAGWWEAHHDWLLERITVRLDVVDGYCFGEPVDMDRLCLDIWHEFAPEPEPTGPPRMP